MQNKPADSRSATRGMRIVAEALRNEDFPMEKRDIDYAVGDLEIEDGRGGAVPVRELTERLKRDSFDSAESVVRALQAAVQEGKGTKAA